jgi:hypothetical protein
MKYCIYLLLLLYMLYNLYEQSIESFVSVEGFVPERNFRGLEDIFDGSDVFSTSLVDDDITFSTMRANADVMLARRNVSQCHDTGKYGDCSIKEPDHEELGEYYYNVPSTSLSDSHDYTYLSICPKTYPKNIKTLVNMKSMGQYSGYTPNQYIDRIRYMDTEDPLPINPDFFRSGGGTFA